MLIVEVDKLTPFLRLSCREAFNHDFRLNLIFNKALIDAVAKIRSMDNRLSRLIHYTEYLADKLNTSIDYSEYTTKRINQTENGNCPHLIDNFDEFERRRST